MGRDGTEEVGVEPVGAAAGARRGVGGAPGLMHDAGALPCLWSPVPVVGFRFWKVGPGGLYGVRGLRWQGPEMVAACRPRRGAPAPGSVPHTRGECGLPPCGIYALADPGDLVRCLGRDGFWWRLLTPEVPLVEPGAYGAVALFGKVVEHERGYRAARARVVGLVVVGLRWVAVAEAAREVEELFRDPAVALAGMQPVPVASLRGGWEEARWMVMGRLAEMRRRAERVTAPLG